MVKFLNLKSREDGLICGYASVFNNIDHHNDLITPGAFAKTLKKGRPLTLLWQHKIENPIGVIVKIAEDAHGLYIEARILPEIRQGKEACVLLEAGAVSGLSVGYKVVASLGALSKSCSANVITEVDLWEVSLVTFPANPLARVGPAKIVSNDDYKLAESLDYAYLALKSLYHSWQ